MHRQSDHPFALLFGRGRRRPAEAPEHPIAGRLALVAVVALVGLSLLEISAHLWKGAVGPVACRVWSLHGLLTAGWLLGLFARVAWDDLRRGRLWLLLPVALGAPLCFLNTDGFGALNSESLGELQFALEQLREPDWGYTGVFWEVYPWRSFLPNIVPTLLAGISPRSYRIGFSLPVFLGLLFFYGGLRTSLGSHRFAAPLSALGATSVLAYPVVCWMTRTFEMAVSPFAFGLWTVGALLACVRRPTVLSALAAAWTAGLLAATFTPGMALAALIWSCILLWLVTCSRQRAWGAAAIAAGLLAYLTVVGTGMYLARVNVLRAKDLSLHDMAGNFVAALEIIAAIDPPAGGSSFTPAILVFPLILVIGYALSLRGGLVPLLGILWCFPVVWASVNLHGKIGPQLPFALYRVVVIVPVLAYCMVHLGAFATAAPDHRAAGPWRGMFLALAAALALSALHTYKAYGVFQTRQPMHAEAVIEHLFEQLSEAGLGPLSDAVLVDRTRNEDLHRIRAFSWYFFFGWTRADPNQPLFCHDADDGRPGIVLVMPGDPLVNEAPERYQVEAETLSVPIDPNRTIDVVRLLYRPTAAAPIGDP